MHDFSGSHVHFVGIGGSGMSGLASILLECGARVSGTDRQPSPQLQRLIDRGAAVRSAHAPDALPSETSLVVASAAIPADHCELAEARRRGLPVLKYAQMLGALMRDHAGIAIAGTHGKSTTTAWVAYILRHAGLDPTFVVGAQAEQLGDRSAVGTGPHFVVEACEFDRSFLHLLPQSAATLNIEADHLDCYGSLDSIHQAFADFARLIADDGLLVINGQDPACVQIAQELNAPVQTFGHGDAFDWSATDEQLKNGTYTFELRGPQGSLGRVHLRLAGRHNVANALAAAALAAYAGADGDAIRHGLETFQGVRRRLERCGCFGGVTVVDDYAHHPTEIRATLTAARERFAPQRLWCVFQPHQHSRTRALLDDFATSFGAADFVLVPRIYDARDNAADRSAVCSDDLVSQIASAGGQAESLPEFDDVIDRITADTHPGDLVLTMGAGDIWKVAHDLVQRLQQHLPR